MANPVSTTAYYCAGGRMLDAQSPNPLVNDTYAERFMGEDGKAVFEKFRRFAVPIGGHQVRCHLIDELVRARLKETPKIRVVLVGAGFDSRAFRLPGGRWVEIDERPVIERKEAVAPASACPNPLERVAIDFARESLADKLAPYAGGDPVVVIGEGITMYLEPAQKDALAATLQAAFPRHSFFVDLINKAFADKYTGEFQQVLAGLGTGFTGLEDDPLARFLRLGYRCRSAQSLFGTALALKRVPVPAVMKYFLWLQPALRNGYQVYALDYGL